MKTQAKDIDSYLANLPEDTRIALQTLRETVKSVAPDAEEVISYAIPAFKYHGMLVGFAAAKNYYGFYPWNGHTVDQFKDDLKGYSVTKGAIHFPMDKPIPVQLVKKIVKERMKENIAKKIKDKPTK